MPLHAAALSLMARCSTCRAAFPGLAAQVLNAAGSLGGTAALMNPEQTVHDHAAALSVMGLLLELRCGLLWADDHGVRRTV